MSDQARLFEGGGPLIAIPEDARPRQLAWYRSALRRVQAMHGKHGHGAEGQTCRGCVHLVRRHWERKTFLKCELYRTDGYDGTDWRAKWPACGAFAVDRKGP